MIEDKLREYLLSDDQELVTIGFELLNSSTIVHKVALLKSCQYLKSAINGEWLRMFYNRKRLMNVFNEEVIGYLKGELYEDSETVV